MYNIRNGINERILEQLVIEDIRKIKQIWLTPFIISKNKQFINLQKITAKNITSSGI